MNRNLRIILGYVLLALLAIILLILNLNIGSTKLSLQEISNIIFGLDKQSTSGVIIWSIRFPRLIGAFMLGGALAISGYLLQTFFSNPIAGPYVLGISSGAKLVVAIIMIFSLQNNRLLTSGHMILAAFIGSCISMLFIIIVASRVKNMSVLIICGVMIGYICSASTDFAVTFADDRNIVNLHNWSLGSFSGLTWDNIKMIVLVVVVGVVIAFLMSKPIGAYQLGEAYARNMGVNISVFRVALILISSLLSACVTAFAGPISFVGIAVPHIIRQLFKTDKPIVVIPACFLGGSVFCLLCDLLARSLFAPIELSISSVTAVFGAPIVIWMLIRKKTVN